MKTTNRGFVKIEQANYEIEDFQFAFGATDRIEGIDFDVNSTTKQVHLWVQGLLRIPSRRLRLHVIPRRYEAGDKLCARRRGGTGRVPARADYWMVGETVVPQALFGGTYTISTGKTERDS